MGFDEARTNHARQRQRGLWHLRQRSNQKADAESGDYLPRADVEKTWGRAMREFRVTLEAVPRRVATQPMFKKIDPVEVELLLQQEIQAALGRLHQGSWLEKE